MRIEKTWKGWIVDDQGWRVLFTFKDLARLGIPPGADPWAEHARVAMLNADVILSSAMNGHGEIQSDVCWVKKKSKIAEIASYR